MAKLAGKLIWLSVNQGDETTPNWVKFACSTSDGFSGSTAEISVATKCDDGAEDSEPTTTSWEFSTSAVAVKDADIAIDEGNHTTAATLWKTRAVKQFKMATADETYYRMGYGFITAYDETAENEGFLEYNLTIKGKGEVALEAPAAV